MLQLMPSTPPPQRLSDTSFGMQRRLNARKRKALEAAVRISRRLADDYWGLCFFVLQGFVVPRRKKKKL